jgi:uncharacterized protein
MSAPSLKANEPSMEEILASIRRIISDDQDKKPELSPAPAQLSAVASPPPPEDVLDLATVATAPTEEVADDDIEFREIEEFVAPPEPPPPAPPEPLLVQEEPPLAPRPAEPEQLLSPRADAAVSSAFNALTSTILTNNARTLEDLVKDMMRPMLKVWLDDNLPGLVERLVRAEIERVTRGPRG